MIDQKPPSAPPCWGRQYDESDRECMHQCEYRLTCKPAFFRGNPIPTGATPLPMYQPVAPPQPFWPQLPSYAQPVVNQPTRIGNIQPPTIPTYQTPLVPQNSIPTLATVPGTSHSSYFNQYYSPYPGETVLQRLGKHMLLKLGQIVFHELASFLALWRWPPSK